MRISTPFDFELFDVLRIKQDHQSQYDFRSQFPRHLQRKGSELPEVAPKGQSGSSKLEAIDARTASFHPARQLDASSPVERCVPQGEQDLHCLLHPRVHPCRARQDAGWTRSPPRLNHTVLIEHGGQLRQVEWLPERASNPHALRRRVNSTLRLPISPSGTTRPAFTTIGPEKPFNFCPVFADCLSRMIINFC